MDAQNNRNFYVGYTSDLARRIEEHNTPHNPGRLRLGAKATVCGAPWNIWGYVIGFGGLDHASRTQNAHVFENFFTGNAGAAVRSVNVMEAKITKKISELRSGVNIESRWANILWIRNVDQL